MPLQIVRNDITKMKVDAIVNTANPMPGYGEGIDRAVYQAAGEGKLLAKRQEIGRITPGMSVITSGYDLPAKYIIHTAGIAWQGGSEGEEEIIRSCYRSIFQLATDKEMESIAIPLLASGHYRFPKGIALRIALSEIERFLMSHEMLIFLVVFDRKAFSLSAELYGDIDAYISDKYVAEKEEEEYKRDVARKNQRSLSVSIRDRAVRELNDNRAELFYVAEEEAEHTRKEAEKEWQPERERSSRELDGTAISRQKGSQSKEWAKKKAASMAGLSCTADRSLDDVVKNLDKSFMELVFSFADAKGMSDVEVQKRANLDRKAFSKLKCGTTKNPSKATALALAIALQLSLDDTRDLLSRAGLALSPCSKQDIIVQYFIEKKTYDIYEINVALFEHGESLLGTQVS